MSGGCYLTLSGGSTEDRSFIQEQSEMHSFMSQREAQNQSCCFASQLCDDEEEEDADDVMVTLCEARMCSL